MSTSLEHKCDDCGGGLHRDECICRECVAKLEDKEYERGKEEGYKQGFEEGQSVNPNK